MGLTSQQIAPLLKVNVLTHANWLIADGLTDHNVVRLVHWYPSRLADLMDTVLAW